MNRLIIFSVGMAAVTGALAFGQQTTTQVFMQAKLDHSQKVLEALVTEDYEGVAKQSGSLTLLSLETDWNVLQTAEYRRLSEDFRRHTREMKRSAEAKNLDGATLAYMRMTLNCVECHKHVRATTLTGTR